jgi:pimeloyl-ACP methyl ester carboxylesterase
VLRRSSGFALVAISAIGIDVSAVAAVLSEMLLQLVDRAGHWPQEEQPEIVSRQLVGFLKST